METALEITRDYNAADVEKVVALLLRYGEFGTTNEASRRNAVVCAHEVLAMLTPLSPTE